MSYLDSFTYSHSCKIFGHTSPIAVSFSTCLSSDRHLRRFNKIVDIDYRRYKKNEAPKI